MWQRNLIGGLVVIAGLLGCASSNTQPDATIAGKTVPDAVAKSFHASFPNAQVEKLDVEKENGVMVYYFEFRDGTIEKECDIAGDGTMLERTTVIVERDVPAPAMDAIRKAAEGATFKRIERVEIDYETRDGKVVKLPSQATQYAVEMTKSGKNAEVVVTPEGKVVEPAKW